MLVVLPDLAYALCLARTLHKLEPEGPVASARPVRLPEGVYTAAVLHPRLSSGFLQYVGCSKSLQQGRA